MIARIEVKEKCWISNMRVLNSKFLCGNFCCGIGRQYGNPDWKMAMKQIEELQKIVKNMDDYRKIVKRQNGRIAQLESRVRL